MRDTDPRTVDRELAGRAALARLLGPDAPTATVDQAVCRLALHIERLTARLAGLERIVVGLERREEEREAAPATGGAAE